MHWANTIHDEATGYPRESARGMLYARSEPSTPTPINTVE